MKTISFEKGVTMSIQEIQPCRSTILLTGTAFLNRVERAALTITVLIYASSAVAKEETQKSQYRFEEINVVAASADEPLLDVWKEGFRADAGDGSGMITRRKLEEVEAAGTVAQLRQLNKMTIRRFRSLVDASPFTPALIREHVPRWVFPRPRQNWYLRERLVTRVTAVLEKREAV